MAFGTDVVILINSGNPVHHGSIIQSTTKAGVNRDIDISRIANTGMPATAIENNLTNRFMAPSGGFGTR